MTGILVLFIFSLAISGIFLLLASLLGPHKPNPAKQEPFECGEPPFTLPEGKVPVRFYLVAMLFVLFDVELVFFFPWAVVYRELGLLGFLGMTVFLFLLVLGFLYAWKKGALEFR